MPRAAPLRAWQNLAGGCATGRNQNRLHPASRRMPREPPPSLSAPIGTQVSCACDRGETPPPPRLPPVQIGSWFRPATSTPSKPARRARRPSKRPAGSSTPCLEGLGPHCARGSAATERPRASATSCAVDSSGGRARRGETEDGDAAARGARWRGGENCVARQLSRVAAYLAVHLVCRAGARVLLNVHTEGFSGIPLHAHRTPASHYNRNAH